jgi:hypothetical protein
LTSIPTSRPEQLWSVQTGQQLLSWQIEQQLHMLLRLLLL